MVEIATVLSILTIVLLAYVHVALVPRVNEMVGGYRQFLALSALGIGYLVIMTATLTVLSSLHGVGSIESVLALATAAYLILGATILADVADDWLRLFADPDYNTWVELSMVVAVIVLLVIVLWTTTA